jgi:hypothetical protein
MDITITFSIQNPPHAAIDYLLLSGVVCSVVYPITNNFMS